ncbi:hypothetical protein K501DRAFT_272568 [Backusella circina FSU 941]|nr:hypothetical protein K501DRAFT_272568 [Backusella circina FSU 941]
MSTTAVGRTTTVNKRRSVLSELGIKPNDGPAPTPTNRRASMQPETQRKKAPPTAIQTNKTTSENALASPKRRSMVPGVTPPLNKQSPLARRSSVNVNNSSSSSKRMSSPAGLESLQEVNLIKEKVAEKDSELEMKNQLLEEKEKEIQTLQENEARIQSAHDGLLQEINQLKETLSKNEELDQLLKDEKEKASDLIESIKNDHENALKAEQDKWNQLLDSAKQDHMTDLKAQQDKFNELLENNKKEHVDGEKKSADLVDQLKQDHENQLKIEAEKLITLKQEHESIIAQLNERIQLLEDTNTNTHVRKVEQDLLAANSKLDEFKRETQQSTESMERRYRDEIRQLQSGSDETASVWLEKTLSSRSSSIKRFRSFRVLSPTFWN